MNMSEHTPAFWRDRIQASAIHLALSLCIALLAAILVFVIWYPSLYREISGGRELFLLLVTVDVILGPLITLTVFDRRKPWSELRLDLAVVATLQVAALVYGLWTVSVARPVHVVFEIDRFRVVHAVDVPPELLNKTPAGIDALPLTGPTLLAMRPFTDENEKLEATMAALQGVSLGSRPDLWQAYVNAVPDILKAAKPVGTLKARFPAESDSIDRVIASAGREPQTLLYLPLAGRKSFWTAFLDPVSAEVVATMPMDSF